MSQTYSYKARTMAGTAISGAIVADSQKEALKMLQQQGLIVTNLKLSRDITHQLQGKGRGKSLFQAKVPLKDIAILARQFSVLYGAGVTIVQSLRTIHKQTANPRLKETIGLIAQHVESGQGLGEAMKRYPDVFPPVFYNMVSAGEVSGTLDEVLERAADHFEREHEIESKVRAALFYPKLVVFAIVVVSIFLLGFVVPKFSELFDGLGVSLPLPTRMLIGIGNIVTDWWWLIAIIFGIILAFISWYKSTESGRTVFDRLSLNMPVFGELNRKKCISRFCRSLSTLSRSGVPIIPALALVRQNLGNTIIADSLVPAQEAIRTGQGIASQLERSGYFPPLVVQMVAVGEETGALDVMLERVSVFFEAEVKELTTKLTQLIEPIVFMFLGIVVTFIILAIMLPMFDSLKMVG